jgi:hypothetical protein
MGLNARRFFIATINNINKMNNEADNMGIV